MNIISLESFSSEVAALVVVAILSALAVFLWNLPKVLRRLEDHLTASRKADQEHDVRIQRNSDRLDLQDSFWTNHVGKIIRTDLMVSGRMDIPSTEDLHPPTKKAPRS